MAAKRGKDKAVDEQRQNNGKFKKGNTLGFKGHPERINRFGRPKDHDELRKLIQRIAGESLENKQEWTRIEAMIRAMLVSKNAADRTQVIEHGWGKVPQQLDINVKDVDNAIERELARLAGRSQTEDAAASSGEADTGEVGSDSAPSA